MISITGKKWKETKINKNSIEKLKQEHNFSEILSKLIISRKFDENEIYSLKNDLDFTNVFSHNEDFKQSINLVINSINKEENIYHHEC